MRCSHPCFSLGAELGAVPGDVEVDVSDVVWRESSGSGASVNGGGADLAKEFLRELPRPRAGMSTGQLVGEVAKGVTAPWE